MDRRRSSSSSSSMDKFLSLLVKMTPLPENKIKYATHFWIFLLILFGALMIAGPHFPNSEVSESRNKDGFISLTVIGAFITVLGSYFAFNVIRKR